MIAWLEAFRAVFWRTWTITWRRPVLLTFSLGQPLFWMLFFGFLFEGLAGPRYLDFLAPGVSVMTVLFGASQSGIGWIRDLGTGFLPRMLSTPASPCAILAGKVAADVARLLLQAAAVLLLALILGARFHPDPAALLSALICLILFGAAFSCLSGAFALQVRAQEAMAAFVHLVNMPLFFTSTALVPRGQMPGWLAAVSRWNPLTLAVDAWRGALLAGELPHPSSLLLLAVLAGVLFCAALVRMQAMARRY